MVAVGEYEDSESAEERCATEKLTETKMAYNQKQFERAMKAALQGPQVKELKLAKHEFNVKPIRVETVQNGIKIFGDDGHHISHCLAWRADDQVYYSCQVTKEGKIKDLEVSIKTSIEIMQEWVKKIGAIVTLFASASGESGDKADSNAKMIADKKPIRGTEDLMDGSWEGEANFLIANIIVYAAAKHLPGVEVEIPTF
jgi:hypothetical protein